MSEFFVGISTNLSLGIASPIAGQKTNCFNLPGSE